MCEDEVIGDWYRLCGHFAKIYESGNKFDCGEELCALSEVHVHNALKNCPCPKEPGKRKRIQNMFHKLCDSCTNKEFARLVGR